MRTAPDTDALAPLQWLSSPIWIFDIERRGMWWANGPAVELWEARSMDELRARDFGDMSAATAIRLDDYLQRLADGARIEEQWTFYPNGVPTSVACVCSPIRIGPEHRLAMMVEGQRVDRPTEDTLRATEALRHTMVRIGLFALNGEVVFQNPSDIDAFGSGTRLIDRFADPTLARKVLVEALARQQSCGEVKLMVGGEPRWHSIEIRRVRDPADGEMRLLVMQFDFADLARRLRRVKSARSAS